MSLDAPETGRPQFRKSPKKAHAGSGPSHRGQDAPPQRDPRCPVETAILKRVAAREKMALDELYQMYANPLYSYAFRVLGNKEDSEEVLQDTFVRIWDKAPKYDAHKSKPFSWAAMILRGLCLDRLRRRSARGRSKGVPLTSVDVSFASEDRTLADLLFRETTERVKSALELLSSKERQCLEMAVFGDISHSEIAGQLDEPLGTVKSRIRRGLAKLRTLLQDDPE